MTREEAIADIRDNIKPVVGGISLDMAIEALEQQPCEDCVSRAKAIEEADKLCLETAYDNEKVIEMLNDLLSVTPKEKIGHKVKEKAKEQTPMEQTLDFSKNLYLQNKEEADKVAREFSAGGRK